MKVVINNCFGGFGLSHKATKRYAELKGFTLYSFVEGRDAEGNYDFGKHVPYIEGEDAFLIHYSKSPLTAEGEFVDNDYFSDRDIERDDASLIQVVEELGDEANGMCASLTVVDIPDGTKYIISEYDGNEHIAEEHKTWY